MANGESPRSGADTTARLISIGAELFAGDCTKQSANSGRFGCCLTDRILITGGSGFIGTNLVQSSREHNLGELINLDLRSPRDPSHSDAWVSAWLADSEMIRRVYTDFCPVQVYHLAA